MILGNTASIQCGLLLLVLPFACDAIKCFGCNDPNGNDCTTSPCEGAWCLFEVVKTPNAGRSVLSKKCSTSNTLPSGKEDCIKSPPSQDGTVSISCACNSQDFCNSMDVLKRYPVMAEVSFSSGGSQPSGSGGSSGGGGGGFGGQGGFGSPDANPGAFGGQGQGGQFGNSNFGGQPQNSGNPFAFGGQNQSAFGGSQGFGQGSQGQPFGGNNPQGQGFGGSGGNSGFGSSGAGAGGIPCYQCSAPSADCTSVATCQGTWCTAQIVRNDQQGSVAIQKGCSPQNPNPGSEDKCTILSQAGSIGFSCACNSQPQCNSKSYLDQLILKAQSQQAGQGGGQPFGADGRSPGGNQSGFGQDNNNFGQGQQPQPGSGQGGLSNRSDQFGNPNNPQGGAGQQSAGGAGGQQPGGQGHDPQRGQQPPAVGPRGPTLAASQANVNSFLTIVACFSLFLRFY